MSSNILNMWLVAPEGQWLKHEAGCVVFSSFGAMMKPFLEGMSVSPEGGHRLFEVTSQSSVAQGAASSTHDASQSSMAQGAASSTHDASQSSMVQGAASHEISVTQGGVSSTHDLHAMQHEAMMFKDDSVSASHKIVNCHMCVIYASVWPLFWVGCMQCPLNWAQFTAPCPHQGAPCGYTRQVYQVQNWSSKTNRRRIKIIQLTSVFVCQQVVMYLACTPTVRQLPDILLQSQSIDSVSFGIPGIAFNSIYI